MYDHPHPRYLNRSTQEGSNPLSQDFQDGNPACKHAFIDLEYLFRFSNLHFAYHDFLASLPFGDYFIAFLK